MYLNEESRSSNKLQKKLSSGLPIDSYIYDEIMFVYISVCFILEMSKCVYIWTIYERTLSIFGRSYGRNISPYTYLIRKIPHSGEGERTMNDTA